MSARLIAEDGDLKGLELPFTDGQEWVIGRDPDASQLVIEDPAISRRHLLCQQTPKGIVIENLSATNPVLLNGVELTQRTLLKNGDALKMGNQTVRFYVDERASIAEEQKGAESNAMEPDPHNASPAQNPSVETPLDETFSDKSPAIKDALAEINFEVVDTGRWLLKVIGGPNNGAEYAMQPGRTYTIGTDPNTCDIVFHDTSVSRQHARITISEDDKMSIEDLKSRNGVLLDGESLKTRKTLIPNTLVSIGTTAFVVYDREGEMQTIISPLLPSIVKVLQKEDAAQKEPVDPAKVFAEAAAARKAEQERMDLYAKEVSEKSHHNFGKFLLSAILAGLVIVVGIGTATLFKTEPVIHEKPDTTKILTDVMASFPSVKWTYSPSTGRLLLVGHVLTASDKNQLLYNLQSANFVRSFDDSGVIIDEYVWQEINQLLANNPNWKGITVQATSPGHFVLTGYLQTRKQSEQLNQYMSENFHYIDTMERKVVVDEDVIQQSTADLTRLNLKNLAVQMSNGELTLSGNLPNGKQAEFDSLLNKLRTIPGVRVLRNYVTELPPEASLVNISDKYAVTGYSNLGNGNISVVINGRILFTGDGLDGMAITSITPNSIMLTRDSVRYKIDYAH